MFKTCSRCHTEKPLSQFSSVLSKPTTYHVRCRQCAVDNLRDWKKTHPNYNKHNLIAKRHKRRRFLIDYFSKHPCVDCGEANPVVLEFDHIKEKGEKDAQVSKLINNKPMSVVMSEIAKCEVRCANCHRKQTAARNPNHWSHFFKLPGQQGEKKRKTREISELQLNLFK